MAARPRIVPAKRTKLTNAGRTTLNVGGQFTSEVSGWDLLASASILPRPERREVTGAPAFRFSAQGRDGGGSQGKSRRSGADRAKLSHDAVHDSARRPAGEKVGERSMAGGLTLQRGAMDHARGRLQTEATKRAR